MNAREPLWRRYLRLLGPDVAADVDDELQFHLDSLEADFRSRGLSESAARDAARERFGNDAEIRRTLRRQDGKRVRRALRADAWADLLQDVRVAVRRLRQRPAFSASIIGVLALGIGATTAMFSAVDAVVLRPLPFAEPGRIVSLPYVTIPFRPDFTDLPRVTPRYLDIVDARELRETFSRVAGYANGGLNLADATNPVRVNAGVVTTDFFATLGVAAAKGRVFTPEEGQPGGPRVTILSHGFWVRHFGSASDVVGKQVDLHGRPHTVVGVMPRGFTFPRNADLWIPLTVPTTFVSFEPFRGFLPSRVVARLADGVSNEEASTRLLSLWQRLAYSPPDPQRRFRLADVLADLRTSGTATPLQRSLGGDGRTALLVLLGATGLILLIACANVTNLLLSHAATRRREIAVRAVLGATRTRVLRQLLTESVVLAMAGGLLGVAVSPLALRFIGALMPQAIASIAPPQLDLRVLTFATVVAVLTGLGFGLWPALGASRPDVNEAIKSASGWGATAGGAGRARRVLLAGELALTLMLVVGAGLLLRSFSRLIDTDSGIDPERVATLELALAQVSLPEQPGSARQAFIENVIERLQGVPGITSAGVVNDLPFSGTTGISLLIEPQDGAQRGADGESMFARYFIASGGYFSALDVPLVAGRVFDPGDDSRAPRVAVINEVFARQAWPELDAVGRSFRLGPDTVPYRVIGVVGDVRERGLDQKPTAQMYLSAYASGRLTNAAFVVRGTLPSGALLTHLRDAVRAADPSQPVYNLRTMADVVATSLAPRRTNTILIAAFGGLGLLLAALGMYAVAAYSVTQRLREFGIRAALGATGADLVGLVAREMGWVALAGFALGLAGAWAGSRVLETMIYDITTHDTATFIVAPIVLLVPVLAALFVPARRALRLNPMDVIRAE